jgi:hypothetical protein
MYAGATFVLIIFLPETFGPILLARRARKIRSQDSSSRVVAPYDLEETDLKKLLTVVITRPIRTLVSDLIVTATCAYLALLAAIFYMSFQAFPIIFQQLCGLSSGITGLCYLSNGAGTVLSLPVFWYWDGALARAQERGASWVRREEYRHLPLACVGGPLFVTSLFWLGFSAKSSISFVPTMLAGIPFGMGYMLIFMALLNYLTAAYEVFAASANAAASCCHSVLAVVLPLTTTRMFNKLGISGACALLGGSSDGMCVIQLSLSGRDLAYERSRFYIALREQKEKTQRRLEEERQGLERGLQRRRKKFNCLECYYVCRNKIKLYTAKLVLNINILTSC